MTTNQEEIDPVLHTLGPLGLYACVQCFLYFLTYITDAHQYFAYIFIARDVGYKCASASNGSGPVIPELSDNLLNSTVQYDKCSIYSNSSSTVTIYPCMYGMQYDDRKDISIVSEFDLVCGRQALAGLTQTLLSLGGGLGAIVCPWVSDLYGRKSVVVASQALMLAVSLTVAFTPNYAVLAVARFFTGFAMSGNGIIAVTAAVELFPSTHRVLISGVVSTIWWVLCIASLSPLAFLFRFRSWRVLQVALSIPSAAFCLVMFFCLQEPLRWLAANGRNKKSESVLQTATKWNNKDFPTILSIFRGLKTNSENPAQTGSIVSLPAKDPSSAQSESQREALCHNGQEERPSLGTRDLNDEQQEKLSFLELVRHPLLRKQALVVWFIWFVDNLVYSALYLMSDTMAVDLYLGFFLNAAVEAISGVFIILFRRLGRKTMIAIFHAIAGLGLATSCVCFYYKDVHSVQLVGTVASLCGKMGIGGAFNVLFLYTTEIFPTNIRNRALGTSITMSTAGAMIAPYSNLLVAYASWAPGAVFSTCCLLVVVLQLMLPESRGKELPQTIRELEMWYDVTSEKEEKSVSARLT